MKVRGILEVLMPKNYYRNIINFEKYIIHKVDWQKEKYKIPSFNKFPLFIYILNSDTSFCKEIE